MDLINPNNPCAGAYADTLDIKLTDECNGQCPFCIERGGKKSHPAPAREMIDAVNRLNPPSVLLLGGEPLLYRKLEVFLKGIAGRKIYITTNGARLHNRGFVSRIAPYLTAINISIHHWDLDVHKRLTGVSLNFDRLKDSIAILRNAGVRVRINANLVKGYLDTDDDIYHMVSFAKMLGADEVRFAELQNVSQDLYVDASNFFDVSDNPCRDGCETKFEVLGMPVKVRVTCGFVNPLKPKPDVVRPDVKRAGVLYPDATHEETWVGDRRSDSASGGCFHRTKRHVNKLQLDVFEHSGWGCHHGGCH